MLRDNATSEALAHASRIRSLGLADVAADSGVAYPTGNDLSLVCIGFTELHTDLKSGVKDTWRMWEFQPYAWHPDAVLVCCQVGLDDFAPDLADLADALQVEDGGRESARPSADLLEAIAKWVRPVVVQPTHAPVRFRADLPHALVPKDMAVSVVDSFLKRPTTKMIRAVEASNDALTMPALVWRWRMVDDQSVRFEEADDAHPRYAPVFERGAGLDGWTSPSSARADVDFRIADTSQLLGGTTCGYLERLRYSDRTRPDEPQWRETLLDVMRVSGVEHINHFFRESLLPADSKLEFDGNGCLVAIEVANGSRLRIDFPLSSRELREALLHAVVGAA